MSKKLKSQFLQAAIVCFMSIMAGTAVAGHVFWSPSTSEENPPITSSNEYLIDALRCTGGYCDNVSIRNTQTLRQYGSNRWQGYFSEEGTNSRVCSGNSFMTGVACSGGYCDNMAIQCTDIKYTTKGHCQWTASFSEEEGYLYLQPGYYAAGLKCMGGNCDRLSVYACQAM